MDKTVVWSDLNERLVTDGQGGIKLSINADSVRTSIDNILRTAQGERVMLPEFALGLRNMLFEPITDSLMNRISNSIKSSIERWDDRVIIEEVGFELDPDQSMVSTTLTFRIRSYQDTFTHTVVLNK